MRNLKRNSGNAIIILLVIVVLVLVGGYIYMRGNKSTYPATTQTGSGTTSPTVVPNEMGDVLTIEGKEFAFSPSILTLSKGKTYQLTFKNTGTMPHNIDIDELGVKTKTISPGQTDTVSFTPSQTGSFTFYCAVGNHRAQGMQGTITIQ